MRKILFILFIFIFTAGFAFADFAFADTKVTFKGNFSLRGSHIGNDSGTATTDVAEFDYYDQDTNLYVKIWPAKETWVDLKICIHDEEWGTSNKDADENISFERVYATHVFPTHTMLSIGLMNGGTWGTSFGDAEDARYRVKVIQPFSPQVTVLGVIEKGDDVDIGGPGGIKANAAESGQANAGVKDAEKDDNDRYAIGAVLTFGDFKVMPLYYMVQDSSAVQDQGGDGWAINVMFLAVTGKVGMFGFEAEYMSKAISGDAGSPVGDRSFTLPGYYANVWANLAPAKVGLIYAMGSTCEDDGVELGFDFDDDFDLTLYLSDWIGFGGGVGLTGMTAYSLYGSYKFSDKMSANASYTMVTSNYDEGYYKDAKANEIDVGFAYNINKYMTYSIAAAFPTIDLDSGDDPENASRYYHKLNIKF